MVPLHEFAFVDRLGISVCRPPFPPTKITRFYNHAKGADLVEFIANRNVKRCTCPIKSSLEVFITFRGSTSIEIRYFVYIFESFRFYNVENIVSQLDRGCLCKCSRKWWEFAHYLNYPKWKSRDRLLRKNNTNYITMQTVRICFDSEFTVINKLQIFVYLCEIYITVLYTSNVQNYCTFYDICRLK